MKKRIVLYLLLALSIFGILSARDIHSKNFSQEELFILVGIGAF